MKVKIVQRKNPQKPDEPGKFYGQPVLDGVVGMDMICRQIAGRSSLTAGDVKNVLTNFLDELPTYMLMNRSVQLEDFGILRISFGSEGVDRAEDFSSSLIRGVKTIFTPRIKDEGAGEIGDYFRSDQQTGAFVVFGYSRGV